MTEHILVKYATRRPYRDVPDMPEGAVYDAQAGYWTLNDEPLVTSKESADSWSTTKKCDQETGEDQKGE